MHRARERDRLLCCLSLFTVTPVLGRKTAYSRPSDPVEGDRQQSSLSPG